MTDHVRKLMKIASLAGEIVVMTPKRSRWSTTSYVSRRLLAELEEALNAAGYDMPGSRVRYAEIVKAQKRKKEG